MGQLWATDSLGGYMYSKNLSKELRTQVVPLTKFRQFADVKDASMQGKSKGNTYTWNVYSAVTGSNTEALGAISESATMPEGDVTIAQGTLTITEYGRSIPYTGKLDELSAQPVKEIINKSLRFHAAKTLDAAAYLAFDNTPLRAAAAVAGTVAFTENGTATATNSVGLKKAETKIIVDYMKERNIPGYEGEDYVCIAHPSTFRLLKDELETVHQYTSQGFGMILNGEIGRFEGVRFVEQTNIPKGGAADSRAAYLANPATGFNPFSNTNDLWNVSTGTGSRSWAFFMGNDTVAEAIAVPEEIRGKIPTDYGRSRGVAWYYLGGFGLVHASTTDATNARVVKWDSAV